MELHIAAAVQHFPFFLDFCLGLVSEHTIVYRRLTIPRNTHWELNINWFEVRLHTSIAEGFWAQVRSRRSKCLESKIGFWRVFQGMSQNGIIVFSSYSLFD